jgi:CubicO group peptidase (beta-lactamase class C family)
LTPPRALLTLGAQRAAAARMAAPETPLSVRISDADLAPARGTPSRCVGAVLLDRVILSQSAGCCADDTLFAVASISKLVTAVVALQCAERGELSLDEDVNTKLPAACRAAHPRHAGAPLTPRMLLQHRSGLCDDESALHVGPWRTAGGDCPASLEAYVAARFAAPDAASALWHPLPPGAAPYHYSNLGITLLALFIQAAVGGGASVATLARERIFTPLGMSRSAFLLSETHALVAAAAAEGGSAGRVALAAPHGADGAPLAPYGVAEWPAAGLRMPLSDLLRFAAQFTCEHACAILTPASRAAMLPPGCAAGLAWWGRDATYGEKDRVCDVWAHGGFMDGIRSHIYLYPRQRLALALMQNGEACYEDAVAAAEAALVGAAEVLDPEGALALRDILT